MTISHEYAEELGRQIDELEAENERLREFSTWVDTWISNPVPSLIEPESVCTGFVRIVATPGPDALRLTVQTPERDTHFAMSPDECAQLAALLIRYTAT